MAEGRQIEKRMVNSGAGRIAGTLSGGAFEGALGSPRRARGRAGRSDGTAKGFGEEAGAS